ALVREYDTVLWVDADAAVLDVAPPIEDALAPKRFMYMVEHQLDNGRVPNAGVMSFRGGRTSRMFLDRVWKSRRFVQHKWWENAAVLHLLGYRDRDGIRPVAPSPWRMGLGVLDTAWNSIPADPSPHPYIVHVPGVPLDERLRVLNDAVSA